MKRLILMVILLMPISGKESELILTQVQKDRITETAKILSQKRAERIKRIYETWPDHPKKIAIRIRNYDKIWNPEKILERMKKNYDLENKKNKD